VNVRYFIRFSLLLLDGINVVFSSLTTSVLFPVKCYKIFDKIMKKISIISLYDDIDIIYKVLPINSIT